MENNETKLDLTSADEKNLFINGTMSSENIISESTKKFFQMVSHIVLGKPINIENVDMEKFRDTVAEILCTLSPRERDVLRLRLGMDDGRMRTLEEVAQLFGVKRDDIKLIEAKALRKLTHPNRRKFLQEFLGINGTELQVEI